MGDIVEPKGMTATLPAPLLWQHDKHQPIGWVKVGQGQRRRHRSRVRAGRGQGSRQAQGPPRRGLAVDQGRAGARPVDRLQARSAAEPIKGTLRHCASRRGSCSSSPPSPSPPMPKPRSSRSRRPTPSSFHAPRQAPSSTPARRHGTTSAKENPVNIQDQIKALRGHPRSQEACRLPASWKRPRPTTPRSTPSRPRNSTRSRPRSSRSTSS